MLTVEIPIKDPKKPPKLTFPDRCVNCGKPKSKVWPVRLNTGAQKRGQMVQLSFEVPMCSQCSAKENKIGNITWIPFIVVGLLACIIVFVPVWLLAPEGPTLQTYELPYVLGAFVGMTAGIAFGSLVEFALKILFAPVYGRLLADRPLTVFSVFSDAEDLIGLSTRFTEGKKILRLKFENDEIAREFVALNPQEK
jgi:hypothetical protein